MNDVVSIITPTYNCSAFITEAIRSVLAQSYRFWEMIIIDDCSSDNTELIVRPFLEIDGRIKYVRNESNCGAAISRNKALKMAKGRWIAFLDSDDVWLPEKLQHQITFMEKNNYFFSYHEYTEVSEDGTPLGVYVSGKKQVRKFDMYACCWPGCLSVMYDASKIGLIQIRDVKKNNDTALWLRAIQKADCYLLKENLAYYRRRLNSITPKTFWQRIKAHYPLFREAEGMNPIRSTFWVIINVFGNVYKKLFYVKKYTI